MSSAPPLRRRAGLLDNLRVQGNVIGALLMRELHTRYGRENIGYLWVLGEPLTLAGAVALLHAGQPTHFAGDMGAVPFSVLGYCVFIMFRGMVNRAEGALESSTPLLYHKMVTMFDIMLARGLLELAGTFMCLVVLMSLLVSIGMAEMPARPLWLMAGVVYMFWFSFGLSLNITAITHDNRLLGRMVHPITYIVMPLSGAFYIVKWIPQPFRDYLMWFPLPHIFEICRYGFFISADDQFFDIEYLTACCLLVTYSGLVGLKVVRAKVHLH